MDSVRIASRSGDDAVSGKWGLLIVGGLLAWTFISGGEAGTRGVGDALAQLLALPVILWASVSLSRVPGTMLRSAAIATALLIVLSLAMLQLPMPGSVWDAIPVRAQLMRDLRAAGVTAPDYRWSLTPLASERALWSVLPALAVFLGALAMPVRQLRRLLLLVVVLTGASLALGILQMVWPGAGFFNPFLDWAPMWNGIFSNPNHQAIALALSVVIVAALARRRMHQGAATMPMQQRMWLALGAIQFIALPLTGSRAALVLAALGLVAVMVSGRRAIDGRPAFMPLRITSPPAKVILTVGVVVGILFLLGWLRLDSADTVRWSLIKVTATMGWAQAPMGAGVGGFTTWFDQSAPADLVLWEYFNHAHNDFVQWWFESGLLGVGCMAAAVAILLASYPGGGRRGTVHCDDGTAMASWVGCMMLLLHSMVEYPLRTPALMTVGALLSAAVVAHRNMVLLDRRIRRYGRSDEARN